MSLGVTYRAIWGRPQDDTLGRLQNVIFQRPEYVSRGRSQDISRGHLLVLHGGPYGDVNKATFGDVLGTYCCLMVRNCIEERPFCPAAAKSNFTEDKFRQILSFVIRLN